jgi:hypothetical protein
MWRPGCVNVTPRSGVFFLTACRSGENEGQKTPLPSIGAGTCAAGGSPIYFP